MVTADGLEAKNMTHLSQAERERMIELIREGKPLPLKYRSLLFAHDDDVDYVEATKNYRLVYKGKMSKEAVLRTTPAAPLQKIRSFNTDNPFDDNWRNMLIFGDNLLALKAIYNDQRGPNVFRTRNKIKLIYIDPPFATRQDFMKDREKAYRDKVIGAQFIEFLRRRLILMHEILSSDGSVYVHLDWKKSHYLKAVLDEVFGECNFQNEIVWHYSGWNKHLPSSFNKRWDGIFLYSRSSTPEFHGYSMPWKSKDEYVKARKQEIHIDDDGREYVLSDAGGGKRVKRYLEEALRAGRPVDDVWYIDKINNSSLEHTGYPTQKPEELLERIITSSCGEDGIVLDAFMGSGTTQVVAEKLGRRWIGIDCGKLAIYTTQQRLLNLSTQIGTVRADSTREHERVLDFENHSKANSRGLLMVYEKARKGDLNITDGLLRDLAAFLERYLSGNQKQEFSLVCREDKFQVQELDVIEDDLKAGEKAVDVGKVRFLISFIQPKEKPEKPKPLKAKEVALYHAGIYDKELILNLDWEQYRPFVLQLFGVREESHQIRGLTADGYIGLHSAYLWEYPKYPDLVLDRGYIQSLHEVMQGRGGDRFYVIAPGAVMTFMEDEIQIDKTTYMILKVPLSVLMALIEHGVAGSVRQPTNEMDVNEVIDAVGYDFISQPIIAANYIREKPSEENLFNQKAHDYVIRLSDFRSNTLASDPEDFAPFETFSMVLVDTDYDGETFNLSRVFWADDIMNEDRTEAVVRLAEDDVAGETMMVIFMDKYGNELKVSKKRSNFKQVQEGHKPAGEKAKRK